MTWQPWQPAWQEALYGPAGFYRRPEGPAGHFATSAQGLGPAAGLLAEAVLELATRSRARTVVEVGAGRGELLGALAVQPARSGRPLRLLGLDVVPRPPGLPAAVEWLVSPGGPRLPDRLCGLRDTLLLAHEWLDVVPCPVAVRDAGSWLLVEVDHVGAERTGPPVAGPDRDWLVRHVPDWVRRAEVGRARDLAYADLVSRVDRGVVVAVDYGHTRERRPAEGTLTAYRSGVQTAPVPDGSCDLTAHVAVDTLGAAVLRPQREVLRDLLGRAGAPPHRLATTDPTAYLDGLSRSSALAALTARGGLGDFWWAMTPRGGTVLD